MQKVEISNNCPLNGFKPCKGLSGCSWIIKVVGKDPQSEETFDQYGCAISVIPLLLIENTQRVNQLSASVESFRNEVVKPNNTMASVLFSAVQALHENIVQQNASIVPLLIKAVTQPRLIEKE